MQQVKLSTGKIHKHHTNLVQVPTKLAQSVPFFSKTAGRHIFEICIVNSITTKESSKASTLQKIGNLPFGFLYRGPLGDEGTV